MDGDTRGERDALAAELKHLREERDELATARLEILSNRLAKEVKEDFYGNVTRILWVAAALVGIATLGGFIKLSDIINERVRDQVTTQVANREKEFASLRESTTKALVDFERKSQESLSEIERRKGEVVAASDAAKGEIARRIELVATTNTSGVTTVQVVTGGESAEPFFGPAQPGVTAIAGTSNDMAYEDPGPPPRGRFSVQFLAALVDPAADSNRDTLISIDEAFSSARTRMSKIQPVQTPVMLGKGDPVLFATSAEAASSHKRGRLWAIVIGISNYPVARLLGSANDARVMAALLNNSNRSVASDTSVVSLIDATATRAAILEALRRIGSQCGPNDTVLVYYSGHALREEKAIIPFDVLSAKGEADVRKYLTLPDFVGQLRDLRAGQKVLIIDA